MAANRSDIRSWVREGKASGATHVIVMCDTYDHEDYPVFVKPGEVVADAIKRASGNMAQLMEVYAMHLDLEAQLSEYRAYHCEAAP